MKLVRIIAVLSLVTFSATICHADIIVKEDNATKIPGIENASFSEPIEPEPLKNDAAVSVPEPATFGLISLALAVGGGLLVRRKSDN